MEKIFFNLTVVDDYPPVSTESLWAEKLTSGNYRIQNIPFYSKDVSFNDVISVKKGQDGECLFHKIVRYSGNSTLRVIFFEKEVIEKVINKLVRLGCSWESMNDTFYSINVPHDSNLNKVIKYLENISLQEELDYEYGNLEQ
nr:DUF4265 domain-containing protein [Mixta theicola]